MEIMSFVIKLVAAKAAVLKHTIILVVAIIIIISVFSVAIIKPKVVINDEYLSLKARMICLLSSYESRLLHSTITLPFS